MQHPPFMFTYVYTDDVHHLFGLKHAIKSTLGGKFPCSDVLRQLLVVPPERRNERVLPFNSVLRHKVGDDGLMLSALSRFQQFLSNKPASKPSGRE